MTSLLQYNVNEKKQKYSTKGANDHEHYTLFTLINSVPTSINLLAFKFYLQISSSKVVVWKLIFALSYILTMYITFSHLAKLPQNKISAIFKVPTEFFSFNSVFHKSLNTITFYFQYGNPLSLIRIMMRSRLYKLLWLVDKHHI